MSDIDTFPEGGFERTEFVLRLLKLLLIILLCLTARPALADPTFPPELVQIFPERVGVFVRAGRPGTKDEPEQAVSPKKDMGGQVEYQGNGGRFLVEVSKFRQDAEAYSMLSLALRQAREGSPKAEFNTNVGTTSFESQDQIAFFKGLQFVRVTRVGTGKSPAQLRDFAQALSESIDKGEAEIPALVKHLPDADQSQKTALFVTRFSQLQHLAQNQTVLSAIDSGGNADAVISSVGDSKVVIVEFNTPQLATDNDRRIIAKIQELWKLGQVAPTAYKRVGNYSVFVFDAPNEQTAKQLIEQVKYEQVVQWLGDNPNIYKEAQRRYVDTTLGVFIAVVKASGYAAVGCLGVGALIGALLFTRRRAQQKNADAFSDAGGMLRLNLDDLSAQTDSTRLLNDRN